MSASPMMFSKFRVHVFVNHDPSIASVFLPDLFSDFPQSAWRLPQQIATPNPEVRPNPIPDSMFDKLYVDTRKGLGQHVFHDPMTGLTTLRELIENLEQEFHLDKKYLAKFTIFPQEYLDDGTLPEWHDRPLPWNLTLNEVAMLDYDAESMGQNAGNLDRLIPILYLVIETKAAALKRSLGGIYGSHFLVTTLGEEYDFRGDIWSRLENFSNIYMSNGEPEIVRTLRQWRSAFHSLRYVENERKKMVGQELANESTLRPLAINIGEFQNQISEAKSEISALVSQWKSWVLDQKYGIDDCNDKELQDDDLEDNVKRVLRQRRIVSQWGKSDKNEALLEMLRQAWEHVGEDSNIHQQQQADTLRPESGDIKTDKLEEAGNIVSTQDTSSGLLHNQAPSNKFVIKTSPFRNAAGTLDPELAKFTIKSGILSWGQILPLYYGSLQENLTNNANHLQEELPGGTIKQHVYTYKSAARTGDWKVRQYYSNWRALDPYDPDVEKSQVGWIVCHDDYDPKEIIQRVKAIGVDGRAISNGNGHTDKDVLYIGRYDWSYHWHNPHDPLFEEHFRDWTESPLEPSDIEDAQPGVQETEEQVQERLILEKQRAILDLRRKLQQGLLNHLQPPQEEDMPTISEYILQLEQFPNLDPATIRNTNIHKVLKAIKRVSIPPGDQFEIKQRSVRLLEQWTELLSAEPAAAQAISSGYEVEEPAAGVRNGGYFLAMDAENFNLEFVKAYKSGCEVEIGSLQEAVFTKGDQKFGAFVSFPRVEYEFAWLVFSGKRDAKHDVDELIAIVYDGEYEVLEGLYHDVE